MKERLSGGQWVAWVVAVVAADLAAASGAWLLTLRNVMVWYQADSKPPFCSNYYGREMPCGSSVLVAQLISLGAFCVVLFGLLWIERRRGWI